uniref:Uncharacterized protein n=1 Tax=Candidatus Kentrum sp. MB TaxID=2138164 RepID=A0A451BAG6_9GAMM|nr:MAG: hypothetical protein BECKMB1821G_GA0114241_100731 [Candidatus Kentron sp. MB]VFK30510.1 MAG: hypothetical protein BECKMB1821I_GA0114274_101613 [Candidatus Kentron sp. MB]VFK75280.1 MAG: hypothetical protein BECKMB1821H_GA0114242_101912 [Candidatus Kentron sp. MB]
MRQKLDYIHHNPVARGVCGSTGTLALLQRAKLFEATGIHRGLSGMVKRRRCTIGSRSFREKVPKLELGNQRK